MEPKFVSIKNTQREQVKEYFKLSPEKQRYLWYTDQIRKHDIWVNVCWYENHDLLVYSESTVGLKMGKNLYPQVRAKNGFSLDKKTNKLKMWYRSTPAGLLYLPDFLMSYGKEWVINEKFLNSGYPPARGARSTGRGSAVIDNKGPNSWLTKGLLEKILLNKITNPSQACQYIIKANRLKGVNPEALRNYIKDQQPKVTLFYLYDTLTDPNDAFTVNQTSSLNFFDLVKQAKALGEKVNMKWSAKRLDDTHQQFTKKLMEMELNMMEEEKVEYKSKLETPDGIELITTRKRLFEEGKTMNHCVYTNYWGQVKDRRYLVFNLTDSKDQKATAGISLRSDGYHLDQIQAKHNKSASIENKENIREFLASQQFQNFMRIELNQEQSPHEMSADHWVFPRSTKDEVRREVLSRRNDNFADPNDEEDFEQGPQAHYRF